jgi:hypothetical protein
MTDINQPVLRAPLRRAQTRTAAALAPATEALRRPLVRATPGGAGGSYRLPIKRTR